MKSEHVIKMRGGAEHIAYPGLLDLAHQQGLEGIDTELIQVPTPDNGYLAIVKATVRMNDPDDAGHLVRTFTSHGDASPESVGNRSIVPHILRMAETRAKARALRDAVNVGSVEFEDDEPAPANQPTQPGEASPEQGDRTPGGATKKAANYLTNLLVDAGHDEEKVKQEVPTYSSKRVSDLIKKYKPKKEEG